MPRQAGPRWYKRRNCYRARFPGAEYYASRDLLESDVSGAWRWYHEVQADYARRQEAAKKASNSSEDLTVKDLMLQYLQALKERVAQGTYGANTYQTKLGRFDCIFKNSDLKNMRVVDLTASKITEFMELLVAKNYKTNYRVELLATIQSMLNWAAKPVPRRNPERLIAANPIVGVRPPTRPRVNRYIETARILKLYRHVWSRYRKLKNKNKKHVGRLMLLMLRLLRLTGARPTEIYRLRWDEIDWKTNQIVLPPERHKTGRKTQRDRTIFLTSQGVRILRFVEKLGIRQDGYVFGRHDGLWDHRIVGHRIYHYRQAFGIKSPIVAYSSRHAYCTEALADGAALSNVSKMVGNSVDTLARNYDHAINQQLAVEAEQIAKLRRQRNR